MNISDAPILLVEDNPDHAELVKISLEMNHLINRVIHLENGEEALNFMFKKGEFKDRKAIDNPMLILLDLRMPKVDGLQVLKELKSHIETKHIPVVVLTTSSNETDLAEAYEYHANSYLVKPVDFEKFSKLINDLGFYWFALNEKPKNKD